MTKRLRIVVATVGKPNTALNVFSPGGLSDLAGQLREGGANVKVWDGGQHVLAAVDPKSVRIEGKELLADVTIGETETER